MYMRITFSVFGEKFNAEYASNNLKSYELKSILDLDYPQTLRFIHPNEFSDAYWDENYEEAYFNFITKNIDILLEYGADDFDIFIEIYKSELEQCNFQILNQNFLCLLGKYKMSVPVSVYTV